MFIDSRYSKQRLVCCWSCEHCRIFECSKGIEPYRNVKQHVVRFRIHISVAADKHGITYQSAVLKCYVKVLGGVHPASMDAIYDLIIIINVWNFLHETRLAGRMIHLYPLNTDLFNSLMYRFWIIMKMVKKNIDYFLGHAMMIQMLNLN